MYQLRNVYHNTRCLPDIYEIYALGSGMFRYVSIYDVIYSDITTYVRIMHRRACVCGCVCYISYII